MKYSKIQKRINSKGTLVIIGGHEQKTEEEEKKILTYVANLTKDGKLVVATLASSEARQSWIEYKNIFKSLGVKKLAHLHVGERIDSFDDKALLTLKNAKCVFFTGGDQLKITSGLGGTEICNEIQRIYYSGGIIAGTSAGASVMSDIMMASGPSDFSVRSQKSISMAPGLGFVKNFIIDQHFAERGRMSRLMIAVSANPKYLGLGIDEDTAVIIEMEREFRIIGAGAVYVINGEKSRASNISLQGEQFALSAHNMRVDILSAGERFDIKRRVPIEAARL